MAIVRLAIPLTLLCEFNIDELKDIRTIFGNEKEFINLCFHALKCSEYMVEESNHMTSISGVYNFSGYNLESNNLLYLDLLYELIDNFYKELDIETILNKMDLALSIKEKLDTLLIDKSELDVKLKDLNYKGWLADILVVEI